MKTDKGYQEESYFSCGLNDEIKVEYHVSENRPDWSTIYAMRYPKAGGWEYVAIGQDLNDPESIERFVDKVREGLLRRMRVPSYGESDEYRNAYGYRIRDDVKYDFIAGHRDCNHSFLYPLAQCKKNKKETPKLKLKKVNVETRPSGGSISVEYSIDVP